MSPQIRHRMTALALSGLFLSASLLTGGSAGASDSAGAGGSAGASDSAGAGGSARADGSARAGGSARAEHAKGGRRRCPSGVNSIPPLMTSTQSRSPLGLHHKPLARTGMLRPGPAKTSATSIAEAGPQRDSPSPTKNHIPRGTGTASPAFAGTRIGEHETTVTGVPPVSSSPDARAVPTSDVAAQPAGSTQPPPDPRPIGLLALTAIICVIGVSVGTIRALVSQRATRTFVA